MLAEGFLRRVWLERPRIVLGLLLSGALLSATVGSWNGVHRSQDFQYSGELVLLRHIDPWKDFLAGDPQHDFAMTQIPNYLPLLYVMLVPYALLPLGGARTAWVLTNLLFAILSGRWVARFYGIRGDGVWAVICLMMLATATRNTIGNGQQSLLVLFFWGLMVRKADWAPTGRAELLMGVSYLKFTFAPPLLLFVLFRRGWKAALLTLIPALSALALVWLWLNQGFRSLLTLAFEPLAVAKTGYIPDWSDPNLMNIAEIFMRTWPRNLQNGLELGLALAVCIPLSFIFFKIHRALSPQWHMALLAVMSYSLFKHHAYDGVVLLFPFCYGLSHWQKRAGRWTVALIAYLFYGERVLEAAHLHRWWFCVPDFLVLIGVLALTYDIGVGGGFGRDRTIWRCVAFGTRRTQSLAREC